MGWFLTLILTPPGGDWFPGPGDFCTMWQGSAVEINCWIRQGEKDRVTAPNVSSGQLTELRAAIRSARDDGGTTDTVLWERPRANAVLRNLARAVLGFGSTVVVGLLLAIAVVGADTRSALLVVLVTVATIGGLFVMVVWKLDVGVTVHADGTLRRSGWNGIQDYDLRSYQRVTVKASDEDDGGFGLDLGG